MSVAPFAASMPPHATTERGRISPLGQTIRDLAAGALGTSSADRDWHTRLRSLLDPLRVAFAEHRAATEGATGLYADLVNEAPRLVNTVLVLDDDPTVSDVVRRYLERADFSVTLASDGFAALAAVAERRPDLVVLDLMLPGLDGLEVCRRLRHDDPNLPVVMLTALGDEAD